MFFCIFWVFDAKENTSKATFGNHVCVCVCVYVFLFFCFFSRVCETCCYCLCTVHEQQPQSLTFLTFFFSQSVHTVHYLWIHKFHFSATFSLKMGLTVLFTHLKIILLQYFSIFSFQFLAVSKRTLNIECFLWLTENKHQQSGKCFLLVTNEKYFSEYHIFN